MAHSQARTVDAYLAEAAPERAEPLRRVRDLARQVLDDHEERMQWGMPSYVQADRIVFGFADRKQYIALYFLQPQALQKNAEALGRLRWGKSCLRFPKPAAMDFELIEKLLADSRGA